MLTGVGSFVDQYRCWSLPCAVSFRVKSHLFVWQFQLSWSDVSVWLYATQMGNLSHMDNQYRCLCEAQPCASSPVHSAFSQSWIQFFACQHCAARTDSSLIFPTLQFQLRTLEFTTLIHSIANTLPNLFISHNWLNFFLTCCVIGWLSIKFLIVLSAFRLNSI